MQEKIVFSTRVKVAAAISMVIFALVGLNWLVFDIPIFGIEPGQVFAITFVPSLWLARYLQERTAEFRTDEV